MSSSRSIAAARNRRAGGDPAPTSRPGTSISAQPAFSQQQQSKRSVTAQNSTPNVPVNATNAKLTVSDAIGLITLRLGRVEQIIMEAEHNGGFSAGASIPDNTHLVDKSVINSIVNRLDSLEKKEKESSNNQQTNKLENEIRDIKDLLMSQMVKYEKFTLETNKRFDDVDEAFVELEKQQEILNSSDNLLTEEVTSETILDTTIISNNLKNAIEQELAQPFGKVEPKIEANSYN
jgi:vacuolar-type H+-ATPase subunit I/STV1